MPYKSDKQRKYFNANRKALEAKGVNVEEWNQSSKGKKLTEKLGELTAQPTQLPYRERVEIFARKPTGEIYGGVFNDDKSFALPGGGVDPGEEPTAAAIRELLEETGLRANNPRLHSDDVVTVDWDDARRARSGRNFAGSKTRFVIADTDGEKTDGPLDTWGVTDKQFYTVADALRIMADKQYKSPPTAAARLAVLQSLLQPNESEEKLPKQATEFLHYSDSKFDELRPLTYAELLANRSTGRWEGKPEEAAKYVEKRKQFERYLRKRLAAKGITHPEDTSFLYATVDGKEQMEGGDYTHKFNLPPETIQSSFFDVVGLPSRTSIGEKGLAAVLKRWAANKDRLETTEFMGMPIKPRIEVMIPSSVKPHTVEAKQASVAAQLGELTAQKLKNGRK